MTVLPFSCVQSSTSFARGASTVSFLISEESLRGALSSALSSALEPRLRPRCYRRCTVSTQRRNANGGSRLLSRKRAAGLCG